MESVLNPVPFFIMRTLPLMSRISQSVILFLPGDILGFMGNSGYGKEGTIGKFPVHLHLGIYIPTLYTDEMSVNPYHILDILRKNTRKYTYS